MEPKLKIPDEIVSALEQITTYVGNTTDWMVVKKEVLKSIAPKLRSNFSKRDDRTKKQWLNDFDKAVIEWWFYRTGHQLVLKK